MSAVSAAPSDQLKSLARRMGMASEYTDARGNRIQIGTGTLRALLGAMGVAANSDSEVLSASESLDREASNSTVPPVAVLRQGHGPFCVPLIMPHGTDRIRWRISIESGAELTGEADFSQLELDATLDGGGSPRERRRLSLHVDLPTGYHRLMVAPGGYSCRMIVAPLQCWAPELAAGERLWGFAAQLYLIRSHHNWGIGDFADLRSLVEIGGRSGADLIGLNPLHSLFTDAPEQASPYSPSSRLLLNVLNIDVSAVPEFQHSSHARAMLDSAGFRDALAACRSSDRVDYVTVTNLKMDVLETLYDDFNLGRDRTRVHALESFKHERGSLLMQSCLFLCLREYFARENPVLADWHRWPEEYRDCQSAAVREFAREHDGRLQFMLWLQWVAEEQLASVQRSARDRGMRIGLYRDLAVGADRAGAETWINPRAVVSGATVGAPPDIHNPAGQNWGLPPLDPHMLYNEGYQSFIELIRTNMRCAGALRIDHAMGLQQLYWIPAGSGLADGAYVQYPVEDLLGILALESHRNQCMVVGEDLGTVPEEFRRLMCAAGILSYRVLLLEQEPVAHEFIAPGDYPQLSIAVTGNHDLPTLQAWWEASDLRLKDSLGLFPSETEAASQREARARDRRHLLEALRREHLIDATAEPDIVTFVSAAHAYLAKTRSMLAMVQLDDLTDETAPVNVPGTGSEYPNWRRRLSINLEELAEQERFIDIVTLFAVEREDFEANRSRKLQEFPYNMC
jgi:4-alpha-glucanotransferase